MARGYPDRLGHSQDARQADRAGPAWRAAGTPGPRAIGIDEISIRKETTAISTQVKGNEGGALKLLRNHAGVCDDEDESRRVRRARSDRARGAKPIPDIGPLDALLRRDHAPPSAEPTFTFFSGEYPVSKGLDDRSRAGGRDREARFRGGQDFRRASG